ncbi:hypothetical protein I5M32_15265 [Pedobacter sp. SD-b]|uniref:Uncharacterized protein n=1 Tax=Pedobacter segetis TaxID=2793069 RepID=A0ABS1BPG4_9SPHI|nr:hypothetical protein [Pedobacter segetis]MBK0384326.1 hypothetical protein [Pedobacter segetis]
MNPEELLGQNEGEAPKESPLISLKKDLEFYKETLREVAVEIMVEGLSAYPIFVAHQHEVALGEMILDSKELGTNWSIQASTLEEFVEKSIIQHSKQEMFIQSYKPADEFMCVFAIVPEGANFIYYPYK